MSYEVIALTIYILKAIAIIVSRDLWGDRFNDLLLKAIAISMSRDFWGDGINNLFSQGDRLSATQC